MSTTVRTQHVDCQSHTVGATVLLDRESTELLALRDIDESLRWLRSQSKFVGLEHQLRKNSDGNGGPLEPIGYAHRSSQFARQSSADGDSVRVTDYPNSLSISPVLPGLVRIATFANLLNAARSATVVESVNSSSPSFKNEGYDRTHRLLVDSSNGPQQASGVRIVETQSDSTKIWCRATRWPLPNLGDLAEVEFVDDEKIKVRERREPILPWMERRD